MLSAVPNLFVSVTYFYLHTKFIETHDRSVMPHLKFDSLLYFAMISVFFIFQRQQHLGTNAAFVLRSSQTLNCLGCTWGITIKSLKLRSRRKESARLMLKFCFISAAVAMKSARTLKTFKNIWKVTYLQHLVNKITPT